MKNYLRNHWKFVGIATILIALVATLGLSATFAFFNTEGSVDDNYVTTGNLKLAAGGGPLVVQNVEPGAGYVPAGVFWVRNDGTYNMKWRGWLTGVSDPKGLRDYVQVRITMNPTGYAGNYGPANSVLFTDVPLNNLLAPSGYILCASPGATEFKPGHFAYYLVEVKVLGTAPDSVQDARIDTNLYLDGTQWINTGW